MRGGGRGMGVAWGRLGARNPAGPCSSVSFAPSPPRFFARGRRQLGALKPVGPCSSVSFAPSPPRFFARGRRRLGARNPAGPYISVPFAPSPTRFFARGRRRLGARKPAGLCSSVPFAPSPPAFFRPWPGGRGTSPLASPCFFVLRHHVPEHSSRSRRAGVVPHRSLALVSSFWGTTSPSTAAVPDRRAWCLTARSCFFVLSHHVLEHRRKVMHERLPPAFVHHFSSIIFSKGKN